MPPPKAGTFQTGVPDSLRRGRNTDLKVRISRLVELMHARIEDGKPLNFTEPTHREITEALHVLAYERGTDDQSGTGAQLKVSYGDGSQPRRLKVRCLSAPPRVRIDNSQALHVGTLSFRHLDYDDQVDLYLIRDRETRALATSEIDDLAYKRMKEILEDPVLQREGSQIIIYQAGLEPLAVGMYRAIIEHLCERRLKGLPTLAIQPVFYLAEQDGRGQGPIWA